MNYVNYNIWSRKFDTYEGYMKEGRNTLSIFSIFNYAVSNSTCYTNFPLFVIKQIFLQFMSMFSLQNALK